MNLEDFTGPLPAQMLAVTDDTHASTLLAAFGVSSVFDRYAGVREVLAYELIEQHPTHWVVFMFCKGHKKASENGLAFYAYPKASITAEELTLALKNGAPPELN